MLPGPILIVDDDPGICWALEYILQNLGCSTAKALSGRQALELLAARPFPLVFLDAKLPDEDGLEVARRMRLINPECRLIMVSGYFYRDDVAIQKALSQGLLQGFINKPFLLEEVQAAAGFYGTDSLVRELTP